VPESPLYRTQVPVSTYGRKVFAFADDCNIVCRREAGTLDRIKVILEHFERISRLECNIEKTNVMPIGNTADSDEDISGSGFAIKKSITVLGMKISNNLDEDMAVNGGIITKIISENISKWGRYNLSLPGRILIAKSMLYSQINYLGSILPFDKYQTQSWESLIHNYTSGNLRTSYKRTFLPVALGGLGLFKVDDFLDAQKIRWVIMASRNCDAEWKVKIVNNSIGDVWRWHNAPNGKLDPVLKGFFHAVDNLKSKYVRLGNNFRKMPIFGEKLFTTRVRSQQFLNLDDLDSLSTDRVRKCLINTTIGGISINERLYSREEMEHSWRGPVQN
jgi:hypothetical protein